MAPSRGAAPRRGKFRGEGANGARDVGAVGIANRDQLPLVKFVTRGGVLDEIGQLVRAPHEIFLVKDTLRQAPEEPRHPVLQNLTTRAQQRRVRVERLPERKEIGFVPAGPMQEEERPLGSTRDKSYTNCDAVIA